MLPRLRSRWTLLGAVLSAALGIAPSRAAAQPSTNEIALARAEFGRGLREAEHDRWADALGCFERAYALTHAPRVLLNVAAAQAQLGHLVDATESYRRYLHEGAAEPAEHRTAAMRSLAQLEPRLAHITLRVRDAQPGDEPRLDGRALSALVLGALLPVDPGPHTVTLSGAGRIVASTRLVLSEGESRAIEIAPGARTAPAVFAPRAALRHASPRDAVPRAARTGVPTWVWFATGAAVVLVAGGTAAGVYAATMGAPAGYQGNLGGGSVVAPP